MKTYTATNNKTSETFTFTTCDGNMAKRKVERKFGLTDITIREEETGEEFPLVDEWLSDSAYVSRCMTSGDYLLYIKHTYPGGNGKKEFAPIIGVTKDLVTETTINENNEITAEKSTHKCGNWYVAFPPAELEGAKYAFLDFCSNRGGIDFEEI